MTLRATLVLLILSLLAVAGAVQAILSSPEARLVASGDIAFPALRDDPDSVARLTVSTGDGVFEFARQPDSIDWIAVDKYDHPVSSRQIGTIVTTLADMRLIEAKTRLPERFARIGVEAPDTAKATSALLRLADNTGTMLAEVIFGHRVWRQTGSARNGTFVRFPDDDQAWLASGGTDLPSDLVDWLDRSIIDIDAGAVAKIVVSRGSEPPFIIERGDPGGDFALLGPLGPIQSDADQAKRLSMGLTRLKFDDVMPQDQRSLAGDRLTVSITTFDGLTAEIVLATADDQTWAQVSAAGSGDAAAKAAEINARTAFWTYRIPDWQRDRLDVTADKLAAKPGKKK